MDAQLGLERRANRPGFDEADQALGEVRCLRPGGQPDGQPPGGEVIDGAAPAVSCGDTVVDETRTLAGLGAVHAQAVGRRVLP